MKIARTLGASVVLFASLTLFASPLAFAAGSSSGGGSSSSGSSSGGGSSSSGDSSGYDEPPSSSGSSSSGSGSSGSGSSSSGSSGSSGGDTSGGCDADCQQRKYDKKRKKTTEPSAVLIVPSQTPTPRAPIRQPAPALPAPTDFVPDTPAQTPVLEQDAESRGSGELIVNPAAASGDSAGEPAQSSTTNEGADGANPELTANASPTATSGDTSTPWGLLGGALGVGVLGAGLAFAPSRKPPMTGPPPVQNYPGQ